MDCRLLNKARIVLNFSEDVYNVRGRIEVNMLMNLSLLRLMDTDNIKCRGKQKEEGNYLPTYTTAQKTIHTK